MKNYILIITVLVSLASCKEKYSEADAYGNFEAMDIIVSSETNGRILQFVPVEGSGIRKGDTIALIDTTLFHLQRAEIDATMKGIRARMASIDAQNGILNQQIKNIDVNVKRTENLLKDDAVPYKQLDDLMGQIAVMEKQIAANSSQKASVAAELKVLESKKSTLKEQLSRCIVRSPLEGTIIQKYSEEGELTTTGKPLAKIANLSVMKLKVYVSGAMIGKIRTGEECIVRIDSGEKEFRSFSGRVNYISEKAEFTPKIIQTKEERVTLVYAVTINVENDGTLKSGMPGEAIFGNDAKNY